MIEISIIIMISLLMVILCALVVNSNQVSYRDLFFADSCRPMINSLNLDASSMPSCEEGTTPLVTTDMHVNNSEWNVGDVIEFTVFTSCSSGGITWRLDIDGPGGRLSGNVVDNLDSTYTVKVYAGESGVFSLQLYLLLYNNQGWNQCSRKRTMVELYPSLPTTLITIKSASHSEKTVAADKYEYSPYFGMWSSNEQDVSTLTLSKKKELMVWKPFGNWAYHYRKIPLDSVKGKWIHFLGKSTTSMLRKNIVELIGMSFTYIDVFYEFRAKWGSKVQKANPWSAIDKSWIAYFPALDLVLSSSPHYVGYNDTDNTFDLSQYWIDASFDPLLNLTFSRYPQYEKAIRTKVQNLTPDVFLFNWGLHSTSSYNSILTMQEYRDMLQAHKSELESKLGGKSLLLWRTSYPTQFSKKKLAIYCRTPARLQCQNEEASDIFHDWEQVDLWPISYSRNDCVKDNRHYTVSNCGNHFANVFLNHLDSLLSKP